MTEPDPALPEVSPEDQGAAVIGAIKNRGRELGLTWDVKLATVIDGSDAAAVLATYDNDTVPIAMASVIGTLGPDQRVYALDIPPSGNFIFGRTGGTSGLVELRARFSTAALLGGVETAAAFSPIDINNGFGTNGSSPNVFTIPVSGWYSVTAAFAMAAAASASSFQHVSINVTSSVPGWSPAMYRTTFTINETTTTVSPVLYFNAGDTFSVSAFQNTYGSVAATIKLAVVKVG